MALLPILFLALSLVVVQGALGELLCEDIPVRMCSLSVSSAGKRCLLETKDIETGTDGDRQLQCRTSEVYVDNIREHIETDECVLACGADRYAIGISSDSLLDPHFTAKLCSQTCLLNCPNLLDLYSNLALAEGVLLRNLCEAQETGARRGMSQLSSSDKAKAPILSALLMSSSSGQISAEAYSPSASFAAVPPAPYGNTYGRELYAEFDTYGAYAPGPL